MVRALPARTALMGLGLMTAVVAGVNLVLGQSAAAPPQWSISGDDTSFTGIDDDAAGMLDLPSGEPVTVSDVFEIPAARSNG